MSREYLFIYSSSSNHLFCPFLFRKASANVCNVLLMRHSELSDGISVLDEYGNVVATSKMAARRVSGHWELLIYIYYKYNTYGNEFSQGMCFTFEKCLVYNQRLS